MVKEEKTEFNVILKEVPTAKRINVIKVIRSLTSLGLKEAKDLIESLPKPVFEGVSKEKAEEVKKLLEESGAILLID
jgi:large subunit ribosomal protein L7/L12